jgi:hypothetical protein
MEVSNNIINQIADCLEAGEKCFIHKRTLEIIHYPNEANFLDSDLLNEVWGEKIGKVDRDNNYIEIEKMDSHSGFKVMEDFAESLKNRTVKIRLLTALEGKNPFAKFKQQIEHSVQYREQWFAFKRERSIASVNEQLNLMLH